MTTEQAYFTTIAVGFGVGLAAYALSRFQKHAKWDLASVIHSGVWGAGIAAGIHLVFCCYAPAHLVHVIDSKTGAHMHLDHAVFHMDVMHRIHIAAGGVASIYLAFMSLIAACRTLAPKDEHH